MIENKLSKEIDFKFLNLIKYRKSSIWFVILIIVIMLYINLLLTNLLSSLNYKKINNTSKLKILHISPWVLTLLSSNSRYHSIIGWILAVIIFIILPTTASLITMDKNLLTILGHFYTFIKELFSKYSYISNIPLYVFYYVEKITPIVPLFIGLHSLYLTYKIGNININISNKQNGIRSIWKYYR